MTINSVKTLCKSKVTKAQRLYSLTLKTSQKGYLATYSDYQPVKKDILATYSDYQRY